MVDSEPLFPSFYILYWSNLIFLFFCLFFSSFFGGASLMAYGGSQANQSYSHQPMLQPQQGQIQATSATYTIGHSNSRSLTH